jgi:hypothetical protein
MSDLLDIVIKLRETEAASAQLEKAVRDHPESESALLSLESLQKRQEMLARAFTEAADEELLDVCSYRMFGDEDQRPSIAALTRAIGDFQSLITVVYDAIKNGPSERARVSADSAKESAFEFGYSFLGSVGFVMTMPNERLLFGESNLDRAVNFIFEMAKAKETQQIAAFAKEIGIASIRKIYQWADDHVVYALNAEIKWLRNDQVRGTLFIQTPELEKLKQTIDQTSDKKEEEIIVTGNLVGGDVKTRKFHMTFEDAAEIKGDMSEELARGGELRLDHRYTATIRKTTQIHYSTEKEDVSYLLLSLK